MVLELIVLGCVVYYYVNKNEKKKRAKAAALQASQQQMANTYHNLPPYPGTLPPAYRDADYKQQVPRPAPANDQRAQPTYSQPPTYTSADEKGPLKVEMRDVKN